MRMLVIAMMVGSVGMVFSEMESGFKVFDIRGRIKTIQITALLRSARIIEEIEDTWRDLLHLKYTESNQLVWKNFLEIR